MEGEEVLNRLQSISLDGDNDIGCAVPVTLTYGDNLDTDTRHDTKSTGLGPALTNMIFNVST